MIKRIQNKVAESRLTLPVVAAYGIGIWLLCGLIQQNWWIQFVCYALSTYLMIELNNSNALIRIYSRTVSAAFIVLSCMSCFLFASMEGAIAQLCIVASLLTIFHSYQDKAAVGWCFYTLFFLSLGSLVAVEILWFVPIYFIVMGFFIYSLSYRTFCASLLGMLLPYWFLAAWTLWNSGSDFTPFADHFIPLVAFQFPFDYQSIPFTQILAFIYLVALSVTGIIHYMRTSFNDKIRIRQIFYSFIFMNIAASVFVLIQPHYSNLMLRMMIITTSPIIAHFVSLTYTRFTNIAFYVIVGTAFILTIYNLWSSSFIF